MDSTPKPGKALIGLTGGIASGKSTVADVFRSLHVGVVDADAVAREVVAPGSEGLTKIVEAFGSDYLTADGTLDRPKLGELVFADAEARKTLNGITHPLVAQRSGERIEALKATGTPYVVYDVPLLVETGLHALVDAVVVVASTEENQIQRVASRDGLSRAAAKARIASQFPLSKKVEVADYVIDNDGTLDDLRTQTEDVHRRLVERFASETV